MPDEEEGQYKYRRRLVGHIPNFRYYLFYSGDDICSAISRVTKMPGQRLPEIHVECSIRNSEGWQRPRGFPPVMADS